MKSSKAIKPVRALVTLAVSTGIVLGCSSSSATSSGGTAVLAGTGGANLVHVEAGSIPLKSTLTPAGYHDSAGMSWVGFAVDGVAWPSSDWAVVDTSWTLVTTGSIECELSGTGGSGPASATFSGGATLAAGSYHVSQGITWMGFTLNGATWPNPTWALDDTSWSIRCQ